jgi:foldase protein PrsA
MLALAACGASRDAPSHSAPPVSAAVMRVIDAASPAPGGVESTTGPIVARVGGFALTRGALARKMAIRAYKGASESGLVPVPPSYALCVSQLRAHAQRGVTAAALRGQCAELYEEIRTSTLTVLLDYYWETGAAEELGVTLSPREVRVALAQSIAGNVHTVTQLRKFLKTYGENISDMLFTLRASLSWSRVQQKIKASIGRVTRARIAAYYADNEAQYHVKEYRDLWLVRTKKSLALANMLKRELESGTSFAAIAKRYAAEQPSYTRGDGFLAELEPHAFAERSLNDAIFSARPGVVSGPVRLQLASGFDHRPLIDIRSIDGYYLFEVSKVSPAHTISLADATDGLMRELPQLLFTEAFDKYRAQWESRWQAKTDCAAGVIVGECRQSPVKLK